MLVVRPWSEGDNAVVREGPPFLTRLARGLYSAREAAISSNLMRSGASRYLRRRVNCACAPATVAPVSCSADGGRGISGMWRRSRLSLITIICHLGRQFDQKYLPGG